jgi:hypothetical protein
VETYIAAKGILQCKHFQRFSHKLRHCRYAPRCDSGGETHLSGDFCTSQK